MRMIAYIKGKLIDHLEGIISRPLSSYTEFRLFLVVVFSLLGIMTIISFLISCWLITRKKLASLYSLWSLGLALIHQLISTTILLTGALNWPKCSSPRRIQLSIWRFRTRRMVNFLMKLYARSHKMFNPENNN